MLGIMNSIMLLSRRDESWPDFNARLTAACLESPITDAQLDAGRTESVLLRGGPGRRRLVQVWPIDSDDPAVRAQAHLDRANREHARELEVELFQGLVLLLVPLPAQAEAAGVVALELRGGAPFGFTREGLNFVPDPELVPVVRAVYAAEDAGLEDPGRIAKAVLEQFPQLRSDNRWKSKYFSQTVLKMLSRREQLEGLL